MDCRIDFDDRTIRETDGNFDAIEEIMKKDSFMTSKWFLKSSANITTRFGSSMITLDLYHDRSIFIVEYNPSVKDVYYNTDLQCLSVWAQENGWSMPSVTQDLIDSNIKFWNHFRLVSLIKSDYLDDIYGKIGNFNRDKSEE